MIRLFIAIDLPEHIRKEVQGMGSAIPKARPVSFEQLHLTLKFIGEVEDNVFLDIRDSLRAIVQPRFSLRLKGVGTFPPRGTPRVLWVGVDPVTNTVALRNSIERTLGAIGIPRSRKKYTPHITLARLRNSPLRPLKQFLAGNSLLLTDEFPVETFTLYSSKLTAKGAIHTVEEDYPLTSGGD